jgi:quinol monooxygenase YgiN
MIGVVALVRVKEGKGEELEAIFAELFENVRAHEPGNITYTLSRKQGSASEYVIQELYAGQDAVTTHTRAPYFRAARARLEACFAEPPVLHMLEPRVG